MALCTVLPSPLLVFSLFCAGELQAGAAGAVGGALGTGGRGGAVPEDNPCASPTRLVLQGCRRGGGGPILWAAGGCPAVHPDRLPGVDHPERGKPSSLSTSPALPCSLL